MISILLIMVMISVTGSSQAGDNAAYIAYAMKVSGFDTTGSSIMKAGDGEITIKNAAGNIIRFRVGQKDELRAYHCGIVFILYEFSEGWIRNYKTYDVNGKLKGDDEFRGLAIVEYEIRKPELLHAKFEVLNEADGNIEMNDKADEIVYMKAYDSGKKLLMENYISSKEYWNANNVMYRP
ncbi:MAG: hypothetical protein JNK43_11870 [Ignavibacteria bacterium]|nr:hypothetical protein [Ignavibacteria bacterium]